MLGELKKDVLSFERIYLDSMNRWHDSFTTVGGELCPLMCSRCLFILRMRPDNYAAFAMPLRVLVPLVLVLVLVLVLPEYRHHLGPRQSRPNSLRLWINVPALNYGTWIAYRYECRAISRLEC